MHEVDAVRHLGSPIAASTATFSASPPQPGDASTRSPTASASTPSPTALTVPATSAPGENGSGGLNWYMSWIIRTSGKFTAQASMSMTTWPASGFGIVDLLEHQGLGGTERFAQDRSHGHVTVLDAAGGGATPASRRPRGRTIRRQPKEGSMRRVLALILVSTGFFMAACSSDSNTATNTRRRAIRAEFDLELLVLVERIRREQRRAPRSRWRPTPSSARSWSTRKAEPSTSSTTTWARPLPARPLLRACGRQSSRQVRPKAAPAWTSSMLGTAQGQVAGQVTYNGHLLYRFAG